MDLASFSRAASSDAAPRTRQKIRTDGAVRRSSSKMTLPKKPVAPVKRTDCGAWRQVWSANCAFDLTAVRNGRNNKQTVEQAEESCDRLQRADQTDPLSFLGMMQPTWRQGCR